jgi:hypothetical protein
MKRLLLFLSIVLCANIISAQTFTVGGVKYTVNQDGSTVTVTGNDKDDLPKDLIIPSTVNGYTVTAIGNNAFKESNGNYHLTSVVIPNTVTSISDYAFYYCGDLTSINIPNSVTSIGERAFYYCFKSTSLTLGNSITSIGSYAFYHCSALTSVTIPSSVTYIGAYAFYQCSNLASVTCLATTGPQVDSYAFMLNNSTKTLTVPFNATNYTSNGNYSWGGTTWTKVYHKINQNEEKTLENTFEITAANRRAVINEGVLKIMPGGELINKTDNNVGGVIEVVTPATQGRWNFVGAPFNGYDLYAMKLGPGNTDATVVEFDYGTNDWSMNYSYANDVIGRGEGFFAWPFYSGGITFSTKRDYSTPSYQNTAKASASDFTLNNGEVTVEKTISVNANASTGRWMALSNPYPAKLSVNSFITANSLQGQVVYVLNSTTDGEYQTWGHKTSGEINVGQGFFVNIPESRSGEITFTKNQISENVANKAKSEIESEKEFIRFAMIEGERESEVLFAHNQDAQEGYDIFDANKLFAMSHIAEPYFVVDGISLVKEEVNLLPYYATMNVKSFGNKEVKFTPKYIPEGLSVTLIDGEESIDLLQGQEYATEISAGENANRFKLLIKKSLGLSDAEELEVNISNDNRIVNIATSETDLQIEVYNALGQKVFETKDRNFSLNNVSAGAYMIKAFNSKGSKTQKIVVK